MFILFGLIGLLSAGSGAENTRDSTVYHPAVGQAPTIPRRLTVNFGGCYKVHVGSTGEQWAPYGAVAVAVDLPTYLRNVLFRVAVDAGSMHSLPQANLPSQYRRAYIGEASVSVSYDFYLPRNDVTLRPRIGLSNTTIQFGRWNAHDGFEPFADSENEFGLLAGIEPIWKVNRLSIGFPLQFNYAFSAPKRFMTFSTALFLGGIF